MLEAEPQLAAREVVLVLGWYAGTPLAEIAGDLGVTRQRATAMIQALRRRGIPMDARPGAWRARGGASV
jgi:biotin operon repressor